MRSSQSYKAILSYDGTHYFGWQKTRTGPSIQEALQEALAQLCQETPLLDAASRTDRGVHAKGQVVAFSLAKRWEPPRLQRALNAVLPHTIRIHQMEEIKESFHPSLDARQKEYRYFVCLGAVQDPLYRLYSWHYPRKIDLAKMHQAIPYLQGTHDFSAFANRREKNPLCTLFTIEITSLENQRLQISLHGNRFLYKMARTLAGTLLYVGVGKIASDDLPSILHSKSRTKAGMSAPAHGLFLHRVYYSGV